MQRCVCVSGFECVGCVCAVAVLLMGPDLGRLRVSGAVSRVEMFCPTREKVCY